MNLFPTLDSDYIFLVSGLQIYTLFPNLQDFLKKKSNLFYPLPYSADLPLITTE